MAHVRRAHGGCMAGTREGRGWGMSGASVPPAAVWVPAGGFRGPSDALGTIKYSRLRAPRRSPAGSVSAACSGSGGRHLHGNRAATMSFRSMPTRASALPAALHAWTGRQPGPRTGLCPWPHLALGHALPFNLPAPATRRCFKSRTRTTLPIAKCGHRFTGSAGPIAKRGQEQTISPLSRAAAIDRVAKLGCYRK